MSHAARAVRREPCADSWSAGHRPSAVGCAVSRGPCSRRMVHQTRDVPSQRFGRVEAARIGSIEAVSTRFVTVRGDSLAPRGRRCGFLPRISRTGSAATLRRSRSARQCSHRHSRSRRRHRPDPLRRTRRFYRRRRSRDLRLPCRGRRSCCSCRLLCSSGLGLRGNAWVVVRYRDRGSSRRRSFDRGDAHTTGRARR